MNLTSDPWIPVVWQDGRTDPVSLRDAFLRGHEIRDLSVRPHERIALMRLLICVAQAALDGPKDRADWRTCTDRLPQAAADYLDRWRRAFELFGDGPRFLQVHGRGEPGPSGLDKLLFVDAGTPTLFTQGIVRHTGLAESDIPLALLTYQCFAPGGCCGGSEVVSGRKQPQKGTNGPCRDGSAFHCYLRHDDLAFTVLKNLLSKEDVDRLRPLLWGRPVWEFGALHIDDVPADCGVCYLSRLVPLSRALWVENHRQSVLSANGIPYASFSGEQVRLEPAFTVKATRDRSGSPARTLLAAKKGESVQHPWRELHSVLVLDSGSDTGGPQALQNASDGDAFDLWLGAFVTSQAKVDDSVEFVFTKLPSGMLDGGAALAVYADGVHLADTIERRARRAMGVYRVAVEEDVGYGEIRTRLATLKRARRELYSSIQNKALSGYWTGIESRVAILVTSALSGDLDNWRELLLAAAREAYDLACPHGTARQMKAYAFGLKALCHEPERTASGAEENTEE